MARCEMIGRVICIAMAGFAFGSRVEALPVRPVVAIAGEAGPSKVQLRLEETNPPLTRQSALESPQATPQPETKGAQPAQKVLPPAGNPLWAIPLRQLSATRDRPLFSPSRQPPPPPPPPVVAAPPPPPPPKPAEPDRPKLTLVGTIIGATQKLGLFLDQTSKSMVRLRAGDSHQGWTLKTIERREATVEKNDATVVIALPAPGEAKPAGGLPSPPLPAAANPVPPRPPVVANPAPVAVPQTDPGPNVFRPGTTNPFPPSKGVAGLPNLRPREH
jgi:hypothetical protein